MQKRDLPPTPVTFLQLLCCSPGYIVTTIYRPPDKPVAYFDQIETLLSSTDLEGKESILMGDLNCDLLCESNNNTKNLRRLLFTYGFSQLIKEPTRTTSNSRTIIDHIITNRTDLVSSSGIIYCGISDHDVVFMQKKMRRPKLRLPPKTISVRNFKHFDRNEFLDDLKLADFDEIKNYSNDANEMWLLWKSLYIDILNKHEPVTNIRLKGSTLPYMTKDLKNDTPTRLPES